MMQGTMPGARRRGRPRTAWMDNIKTWTELPMEESIRMTEDRDGESTSMVWPTLGSRGVTCHPTEVTFPPLPQPKLVYLIKRPRRDARLSWPIVAFLHTDTACKNVSRLGMLPRRLKNRADFLQSFCNDCALGALGLRYPAPPPTPRVQN